jgi:alpha-beta hydrolase superfamily lysophospholipase
LTHQLTDRSPDHRAGEWISGTGAKAATRVLGTVSAALAVLALVVGCAGALPAGPQPVNLPVRLITTAAVMDDGYRLPLRRWGEARGARGLVLALHGFNDHAGAFVQLGPALAARGFLVYAYDQRGFGTTAGRGRWAGEDRLIADLRAVAAVLRQHHPRLPLTLLGESMGGAVIMAAAETVPAAGRVLIAPAVWSRDTMHPVQRAALAVAANTLPWLVLTGKGVRRPPSDNRPMLRAYAADPLVIKATRIEALWGVTNLMDRARAAGPRLPRPALVLYGEHDRIIPRAAFCTMLDELPTPAPDLRLVLYAQGWHLLTRDLQGDRVINDIAAWLTSPQASLPSGEETVRGSPRLRRFCADGP